MYIISTHVFQLKIHICSGKRLANWNTQTLLMSISSSILFNMFKYIAFVLLIQQTIAQSWNGWEDPDTTVTNTVTNIHYTCPCDASASPWSAWTNEVSTSQSPNPPSMSTSRATDSTWRGSWTTTATATPPWANTTVRQCYTPSLHTMINLS